MSLSISAEIEAWPIAGSFTISRGSKTEAVVVVVEISDGIHRGRGECTPYPRYGETPDGVKAEIEAIAPRIADGSLTRLDLQTAMKAGAARNALDCAIWDFEAKRQGKRAWTLAGLPPLRPVTTAYTISLGTPEAMAEATEKAAHMPLLKVKLGGEGDEARITAVRGAAPHSDIIVDANEAWPANRVADLLKVCADHGVSLVEQPLPAGKDQILDSIDRVVPVCADESVHDRATLPGLVGRYDAINIKL
ncbi:MAG: dipeptide epimerase, partial [Rhodobiaceae bacterium]|nr:dipeptide epimerase [Rhodobiaceae bacterium]